MQNRPMRRITNSVSLIWTRKCTQKRITEFKKAIDLDPDFTVAYISLGTVYLEMGQLDDAANAAKAVLRIDAASLNLPVNF